jgi:DNA-binding transcriptional LysR family regulator
MDVRLLEAFRAVVDHRSMTHAAVAMGVTQPAVSAQIARLEQELDFALFDRGIVLKPTPEGSLFYAEASKALSGIDRLTQAAQPIRGPIVHALEPAISYDIGACSARDREPSLLAQAFLALLSDTFNTLEP